MILRPSSHGASQKELKRYADFQIVAWAILLVYSMVELRQPYWFSAEFQKLTENDERLKYKLQSVTHSFAV